MATRIEKDSMGELEIPADAYYGVQTQRAITHFPISGWKTHREQILATVHIKKAAAQANKSLKTLDAKELQVRVGSPNSASDCMSFTLLSTAGAPPLITHLDQQWQFQRR